MAKNKKNAKQLREEQKALKMQKIQLSAKVREQKNNDIKTVSPAFKLTKKDRKKSFSKASGLKSNFVVDNNIIMTSYGKGSLAKLEHKINSELNTESLAIHNSLNDVNARSGKKITFNGRISGLAVSSDNPMYFNEKNGRKAPAVGSDLLCLKDALENLYFGKNFNDNIHVQLIYQILDIEKILAVHVNNIVFALDNILHKTQTESDDFIGAGGWRVNLDYKTFQSQTDKYKRFQNYTSRKELMYFGETFYHENKIRSEEDIFAMLTMISALRQFCFHSISDDDESKVQSDWLYRLDEQLPEDFAVTLDNLWKEVLERLDNNFLSRNTVNLHILCDNFNHEKPENIIIAYYNFLMKKTSRNMGFSIKRLREYMLEDSKLNKFKDDKYNSVRHKLYQLFDFIIAYYYQNNPESCEILVSSLRACLNDEEKEKIYIRTAEELVSIHRYDFEEVAENVSEKYIQEIKNKKEIYRISLEDVKISNYNISLFSKLIYMVSMLLDGKEINDLLTTLINKFDNIIGFMDTMKKLNLKFDFNNEYTFFNLENCKNISSELRIINSLARMQKPSANAKKVMYRDALRILGMEKERSDEELDNEINKILQIGADGKPIKGAKKGFRNFIVSNVIESSRFQYLVRYNNPHKTRELAKNSNVVGFVLSSLPDTQIKRYFDVCKDFGIADTSNRDVQTDILTNIIISIDYKMFEDVPQSTKIDRDDPKSNCSDALKKQRYQAIVSLYLTVMYLVTKNLVYVNSRYVMAFHCLERDAFLYGLKEFPTVNKKCKIYSQLTENLLEDENYKTYGYFKNIKWQKLIEQNLRNSDKKAVHYFRNIVAHISAVRNINEYISGIRKFNSYFELYHYLVQSMIEKNNWYDSANQPKTKEYIESLKKYNTYCKDFVKAYCIPFGYVIPRYKNLTVNELFDKNNPLPEPKRK